MAQNNGTIGFEDKLWKAADKLRNNMDAAEYKHVVLGLIFLKYISDKFSDIYMKLQNEEHADPEDPEEYKAENAFWVPKEARWEFIQSKAKMPEIGKIIDTAMDLIEAENEPLKGVLPKSYNRPTLDKKRLGELVDLIGTIALNEDGSKDVLGRVYEYFLGLFASAEGKKGGQFYTPRCVVKLLVDILEPFKGRIFDPCCGSGGMFVQSEKFIKAHGGTIGDLSIYGQESNPTTWKLAKMNMAIRGIDAKISSGDSFHENQHKDLKADYILANPPFNDSDWNGHLIVDDMRWKFGVPPKGNANFAWVQHFIHHLSPKGRAGFVLANVSLSSTSSGEDKIRKRIIEDDLVDCIITLPERLFYNTGIPACLWFINRDKKRKGEILLINAKHIGKLISRKHRDIDDKTIREISNIYHDWEKNDINFNNKIGFYKSVKNEEVLSFKSKLLPGLHVGLENVENQDILDLKHIKNKLLDVSEKSKDVEKEIKEKLKKYGENELLDAPFISIPNSMIQEILQSIYEKWFVDFNFPNNENLPYKDNSGKFKETALGRIPENWNLGNFRDIAKIKTNSISNEKKNVYNKYVALEDIPRKRLFLSQISSVDAVNSSIICFKKGDILFGSMRPYFHKVTVATFDGITRTTTFVIEPKDADFRNYLLMLCFDENTVNFADITSEGSTIPYAVFENLERMPTIIPDEETAKKFNDLANSLLKKATINIDENLSLNYEGEE
jgi:type I restriction enzyme M protein